ncbi:hypothetical protein DRP04_04930 [Archaeoglobales archaeon]|nr:MAG: hypothetical protein DRP04_04930 [Archaeoglobales archaeon]
MEYLLILNYESDAERKRIDYTIERWRNRVSIRKPKGAVVVLKGSESEFSDFIEDLFSRLELEPNESPEGKVEVYLLEKYKPVVEKKVRRLSYESTESLEIVRKFLDYLMAKLNASYEYSSGISKVYTAYTKKGQARIDVRIEKGEVTKITILIEGYGEVVDFLAGKVDYEIKTFLGRS